MNKNITREVICMGIAEAEARLFKDVWICMKCNARNRGYNGRPPERCRRCGSKRLRRKKAEPAR